MPPFPTYDPETDSVQLNGCASILLTLLLKAKFGEKFDPEILFHERVSDLVRQLDQSLGDSSSRQADCFNHEDLYEIAKGVFAQSLHSGWWSKSPAERVQYLQDAAAPWVLSPAQIEAILDGVESLLFRSRQITSLADSAGEP